MGDGGWREGHLRDPRRHPAGAPGHPGGGQSRPHRSRRRSLARALVPPPSRGGAGRTPRRRRRWQDDPRLDGRADQPAAGDPDAAAPAAHRHGRAGAPLPELGGEPAGRARDPRPPQRRDPAHQLVRGDRPVLRPPPREARRRDAHGGERRRRRARSDEVRRRDRGRGGGGEGRRALRGIRRRRRGRRGGGGRRSAALRLPPTGPLQARVDGDPRAGDPGCRGDRRRARRAHPQAALHPGSRGVRGTVRLRGAAPLRGLRRQGPLDRARGGREPSALRPREVDRRPLRCPPSRRSPRRSPPSRRSRPRGSARAARPGW